ncbi:MAG: hypothetical protein LBF41_01080 [Deltaproteobacteria bacterium]|jgi:hypothetical protein|nr:hypothetical protein [Deltaproteobacteria bacterium]
MTRKDEKRGKDEKPGKPANADPGNVGETDRNGRGPASEKLDRVEYFRKIREDLMVNLGMPKDTKPQRFLQIMEIRAEIDRINAKNSKKH